jgi:hypothetical protein
VRKVKRDRHMTGLLRDDVHTCLRYTVLAVCQDWMWVRRRCMLWPLPLLLLVTSTRIGQGECKQREGLFFSVMVPNAMSCIPMPW